MRTSLCLLAAGSLLVGSAVARADTSSASPNREAQTGRAIQIDDFSLSYDQPPEEGGGDTMVSEEVVETRSTEEPILWKGFLFGLRGYEKFPLPVSTPYYFEDPFIRTDARLIYVWHKFPDGSALKGGDLQVWSLQIRVALTERLALIATKDGYSRLRARSLPPAEGWNDAALGLKYALWYDVDEQWILTAGLRWEWENGSARVLQGNGQELSPFISFGKGWDKLHLMGAFSYRIPMDHNEGTHSLVGNLHLDYELFENFYPLMEVTAIQYLSSGDSFPLSVDGIDYTSIGANSMNAKTVFSGAVGFRWHICPHVSLGAAYEFPLMNPNSGMFDDRVTVNIAVGL